MKTKNINKFPMCVDLLHSSQSHGRLFYMVISRPWIHKFQSKVDTSLSQGILMNSDEDM